MAVRVDEPLGVEKVRIHQGGEDHAGEEGHRVRIAGRPSAECETDVVREMGRAHGRQLVEAVPPFRDRLLEPRLEAGTGASPIEKPRVVTRDGVREKMAENIERIHRVPSAGRRVIDLPANLRGMSLVLARGSEVGLEVAGVFPEIVPEPCQIGPVAGPEGRSELRGHLGNPLEMLAQRLPMLPGKTRPGMGQIGPRRQRIHPRLQGVRKAIAPLPAPRSDGLVASTGTPGTKEDERAVKGLIAVP